MYTELQIVLSAIGVIAGVTSAYISVRMYRAQRKRDADLSKTHGAQNASVDS